MIEKNREIPENEKDRLIKLRDMLVKASGEELLEQINDSQNAFQIIKVLTKTQFHLLRVMNCEFLFHHVITNIQNLNQSQ